MKILILGGDGYLGWPTAMHLSAQGHQVAVVDNYLRRSLCRAENVEPLVGVPNLHQRAALWHAVAGFHIPVYIGDLRKWEFELFDHLFAIYLRASPELQTHLRVHHHQYPYSQDRYDIYLFHSNLKDHLHPYQRIRQLVHPH